MINLINGKFQNASNMFVPGGSISFTLNTNATVIAPPGGLVPANIPIVFAFDVNGDIVPNDGNAAQIYSNVELNPQNQNGLGTFYNVTVYDQNGARLNRAPMSWQFIQPAGSTVDISKMIPVYVEGTVIFYPQPKGNGNAIQMTNPGATVAGDIVTYDANGNVQDSGVPVTSIADVYSNWLNVEDFGAKGDGSTDDTAAIQAAFNAVTAQRNIVFFPNPSVFYKISAAITDPTSGLLQGVIGEAGGVNPGVEISNQTGTPVFNFTNVSALGFTLQNIRWVGPGRGVASSDGVILANVTGSKVSATAITPGTGNGLATISVATTALVSNGGNIYLSGWANPANNGFFQVQSFTSNTITIYLNNAVGSDSGFYQVCANVGEASIQNVQATGWGGSSAYALRWVAPIVCNISQARFLSGNAGILLQGGTSVHLDSCYALDMDKAGYTQFNCSYNAHVGCATDSCGTGYLVAHGANACGYFSCGHEEGTAFNLNITNTQVVGGVATLTYSGPDLSSDYYQDLSVVIEGTTNGGGELNGRHNVNLMIANTIVLFGSFSNFASAPDSGTAAIHAGDGYSFNGCTNIMAYACKSTNPQQTTSSAGVLQVAVQSGFRDCDFNQGPGSLETNSIHISSGTNVVISNCSLASSPNSIPAEGINYETLAFQPIGNALATSGANQPSNALQIVANVWDGSASVGSTFQILASPGSGSNPTVDLQFTFNPGASSTVPQVQFTFPAPAAGWNLEQINDTAATSGQNYSAGSFEFQGQYWNGSASASDDWKLTASLGTGSNPTSTLSVAQSGSSGSATIQLEEKTSVGLTVTVSSAAMFSSVGTVQGNNGIGISANNAFVAQATNDLMAGIAGLPSTVNVNGQTGVHFYAIRGVANNASYTGTPAITADVEADGSATAGSVNYGFYEAGTNPNQFNGSIVVGTATGGSEGVGTINVATGIYLNGTQYTNPDFVFERHFTGKIEKFKNNPGAADYQPMTLEEIEAYARANYQLPRVGQKRELFSRADVLLEKVEELFLVVFEQHREIAALKSRIATLEA